MFQASSYFSYSWPSMAVVVRKFPNSLPLYCTAIFPLLACLYRLRPMSRGRMPLLPILCRAMPVEGNILGRSCRGRIALLFSNMVGVGGRLLDPLCCYLPCASRLRIAPRTRLPMHIRCWPGLRRLYFFLRSSTDTPSSLDPIL